MRQLRYCARVAISSLLVATAGACSRREVHGNVADSVQTRSYPESQAEAQSPLGPCLPLWPAKVRLTGIIGIEQKYGPPGYGENPKRDKRMRIFVLKLTHPADVCADTSSVAPAPIARHVLTMQLTENLSAGALEKAVGISVEVFGSLRRQVWPSDFTDPIIRVDSIPAVSKRSATEAV